MTADATRLRTRVTMVPTPPAVASPTAAVASTLTAPTDTSTSRPRRRELTKPARFPGHVQGAIECGGNRERDAQAGPQRANHANREGRAAAGERADIPPDLRTDHGHSFKRRVHKLALKVGIACEYEPENRREHQ